MSQGNATGCDADLGLNAAHDLVSIRGRQIALAELVDRRLLDARYCAGLREQLLSAKPYPHLVMDGCFHPTLLELVNEEFDLYPQADLRPIHTKREYTYRSQSLHFGPATTLYFGVVNAGWFVNALSAITGVGGLLPDPDLRGGGLHESREGGRFQIHRDFERHPKTGLYNETVLLTYLNKQWSPDWQGALELWDVAEGRCAKTIQPDFGRTLLLPNSPISYHGHATPLTPPPGRTRRSVGSYYYSARFPLSKQGPQLSAFFIHNHVDRLQAVLKNLMPPILWRAIKRVAER